MEPSELPPFPAPEPPPPVTTASTAGRGMPMFLQAPFLLAFWPAVYFTHEHTAALIAVEQKVRENEEAARAAREAEFKRSGIGKWESVQGDGAVLELTGNDHRSLNSFEGRFTLSRNGEELLSGRFHPYWGGDGYWLENPINLSYSEFFSYRVKDDELVLDLKWRAGLFEGVELPSPGIVRFKRLK